MSVRFWSYCHFEKIVCGNNFVFRYMYCKILFFSSFFVWIMINLESFGQVNDSMFNDDGEAIYLPDGLGQFRMNLVELFVDICQILGSTAFRLSRATVFSIITSYFLDDLLGVDQLSFNNLNIQD